MTDISQALRELLLARAAGRIDGEEFERRQAALHAELLAAPVAPASVTTDRKAKGGAWRWALIGGIVLAAGGLYAWLGNPSGMTAGPATDIGSTPPPMAGLPEAPPQSASGGDLKVMAGRLAEKLAKDPQNAEGWALLAQTYVELRQHKQADAAFAKAAALQPPDARALADWADAHVVGNDRKWDTQARDLVARALAADPKQLKALALAGSEAFDRADYKKAIDYWKQMRTVAPAGSMDAKLADANIEEATALMSGRKPAGTEPAPAAGGGIEGTVSLAAGLKGKLAPTDTVFVMAKPVDGTGAPLAVKRFTVAELPATFRLGDADAMVPTRTLSRFGEAVVSARISRSGDATAQAGDIISNVVRTRPGAGPVDLQLGR